MVKHEGFTLALDRSVLLICLGRLDDRLDMLLLFPSGIVVAPPVWSFVFAVKPKVSASLTLRLSLVTLLAP
jgi:hypothetical protein